MVGYQTSHINARDIYYSRSGPGLTIILCVLVFQDCTSWPLLDSMASPKSSACATKSGNVQESGKGCAAFRASSNEEPAKLNRDVALRA
jgi:hypothetical protein